MKKISRRSFMAAAAVSVAALAMTACGGSASSAASSVASSAASSEAASSAAAADLTTVEAGKLTMATNAAFPPYEMTTDAGEFEGIDIDTAKAIAYGLAEPDKDIWELYEHTRKAQKCLPVASILTIAAAGSETSNSSVITREDTHQKRAYNDDLSRPKFAIMDPELTKTLPDYQTESGCADIMMHTMERYFTNGGNMELTDALAEGLLRTVMKNARILHTDPANDEARAEVMWAGSLSHNGLTGCGIASGDFMSHKMEHEMGGMFDVTHGAGLAALWPSWARYVYKDCLPRFVRFARNVMGVTADGTDEEVALLGIDAMVDFYHSIGMPASFHELGIAPTDAQINEMARRCLEASGTALGSAKKLSLDDIIAIYHAANT